MGNSKQARFSRIGGTPHNSNHALHLHMTSAPASTTGRVFRTPFLFHKGMVPSNQNDLRYRIRTLTPEIRRQLYEGGGRSYESMKPPPPEFEKWVKFYRDSAPAFASDLSLADPFAVQLWDASKGSFVTWNSTASDLSSRVFTLVRGTPYESHERVNLNRATDFCGNAVDASFLVSDQPFAVRLQFDPSTFTSDTQKFHFEETITDHGPLHPARDPKNYDVSASLVFKSGFDAPMTRDLSAQLGEKTNQGVDLSFSTEIFLNNDLSKVYINALREGDFYINPQITQRSKGSGMYVKDPLTARNATNHIDVSNSLASGIFVYTPPYLFVDASMVHGDVHQSGLANQSTRDANTLPATHRYPFLNHPQSSASVSDMSALVLLDTTVAKCGIHVTTNHPFPSKVRKDWIHDIKYSFIKAPNWATAKSVNDISIVENPQTQKYDGIKFNILTSGAPSNPHFWIRTDLVIPNTCKQITGKSETSVHFIMDLSANIFVQNVFTITSVSVKRNGNWKSI